MTSIRIFISSVQKELAEERPKSPTQSSTQSPTQSFGPVVRLLVELKNTPLSSGELRELLKLSHRPTFRQNYLHPALEEGFVELTIPDKPNSSRQKYRLTAKGRDYLKYLCIEIS